MYPDPEPGWKLLAKSLFGIAITFIFSLVVLGAFVHVIDGGGSWWFTGHHLNQGQWYEAVRNTVATVALSVAGGVAYLAYRRQRTADLTQHTAAEAKQIAANAQETAAQAQLLAVQQYDLAVQRRDDDEVRELRARFSTAAEHLAHASPAVRIAGVYAMTALAEDWAALQRTKEVQVCIDVLCGYLRLPYSPEHGDDHHSKLVVKHPGVQPDTSGDPEFAHPPTTYEEHFECRQNDRQVRQTIVRVISAHLTLSPDDAASWSKYDFDFQSAHLEDASFYEATFSGENTSFRGATISGDRTIFARVTFGSKSTYFEHAAFIGKFTTFLGATFSGEHTSFHKATFCGEHANFRRANFSGENTIFVEATFSGDRTNFDKANFSGEHTSFRGANFSGYRTDFGEATFSGEYIHFDEANFSGEDTSFRGATFSGENTDFGEANFSGGYTDFKGAAFSGATTASFVDPQAWNNVVFDWDTGELSKPTCISPSAWPPEVVVRTSDR